MREGGWERAGESREKGRQGSKMGGGDDAVHSSDTDYHSFDTD